MSDITWLKDCGAGVLIIVSIIVLTKFFGTQRGEDRLTLKALTDAIAKNSDSVAILAQGVLALTGTLGERPCLMEDLKGKATQMIREWQERQDKKGGS